VQDAGFGEYFAVGNKTMAGIETQRMGLGMQVRGVTTLLPGAGNQPLENGTANAAAAPFTDDGNAADMTVRQQAAGTDRASPGIQRQRMHSRCISLIPFQLFGYLLLNDEHPAAQILERRDVIAP